MTKAELSAALEIAKSERDLTDVDDTVLHGLYLPEFPAPATTTLPVVAKMIRHLCIYLNGEVVSEELDQFARVAQHKIQVIG